MAKKQKYLLYRGKPLVRSGNIIYYGNMSDPYIVMMMVSESIKLGNFDLSTKVSVQLQYTNPDVRGKDKTLKKSEKEGIYSALDIGAVWLQRALDE